MSSRTDAIEIIEVLLNRVGFVARLAEYPADKPTLVDDLGVSRSTVDRATRELETTDLVTYADGRFELTPLGQMATTEFESMIDTIRLRRRLEPFFRWIPDVAFDLDPRLLADAEIILAEPGDPRSMIHRHVELLDGAGHYRVVLPFTALHTAEAVNEQLRNGARVEAVVSPTVRDLYFSTPGYTQLLEAYFESGGFEAFVCEGAMPYCLAIIDETVHVIVAEGDEPRALLESDSPAVYDWAEHTYREYRNDATRITL